MKLRLFFCALALSGFCFATHVDTDDSGGNNEPTARPEAPPPRPVAEKKPTDDEKFEEKLKTVDEHLKKAEKLTDADFAKIEGQWQGACSQRLAATYKPGPGHNTTYTGVASNLELTPKIQVTDFDLGSPAVVGKRVIKTFMFRTDVDNEIEDGFLVAKGENKDRFKKWERTCGLRSIEQSGKPVPYLFCKVHLEDKQSTVRDETLDLACVYTRPNNVQLPKKK